MTEFEACSSRSTGKIRDTETGNDYFGARYYTGSVSRFMSPDWSAKITPVPYAKLDNPQSLNLYAYVLNDPLTSVDPDGHWCLFGIGTTCNKSTPAPDPAQQAQHYFWNGNAQANYADWYKKKYGHLPPAGQCPTSTCHTFNGTLNPLPQTQIDPNHLIGTLAIGAAGVFGDIYWQQKEAPTQVEPGTKQITDMKPSSRSKGEVYERTTYYDDFGRSLGQTHYTSHGEPDVHPNPHYHLRDPITGQTFGPFPGIHPADPSQQ